MTAHKSTKREENSEEKPKMTRAEVEAGWTNGNDSFHEIAGLTGVNVSVIIRVEREVWIDDLLIKFVE